MALPFTTVVWHLGPLPPSLHLQPTRFVPTPPLSYSHNVLYHDIQVSPADIDRRPESGRPSLPLKLLGYQI